MKYDLILADPPWRYSFSKTKNRRIENHYPTLTLDRIMEMPVGELAKDDCMLYLWATAPKLREALAVMEAWGFEYRTHAAWDKEKIGMGYYFRGQHELLLVGKRGKPAAPPRSLRGSSVIRERRGKHSKKPEASYVILERMYPTAAKVELFARTTRAGWDAWGNEIAKQESIEWVVV